MFSSKKICAALFSALLLLGSNTLHGLHFGSFSLDGTDHATNQDRVDVDVDHNWFAVYDGHGDLNEPDFLVTNLQRYFRDALSHGLSETDSFTNAFARIDSSCSKGGSTATTVMLNGTKLTTAWVGDSEAFIIKNDSSVQPLIVPHDFTGTKTLARVNLMISRLLPFYADRTVRIWMPHESKSRPQNLLLPIDLPLKGFEGCQKEERFGRTCDLLARHGNIAVNEKTLQDIVTQLSNPSGSSSYLGDVEDLRLWIKGFAGMVQKKESAASASATPLPTGTTFNHLFKFFASGEFCVQCSSLLHVKNRISDTTTEDIAIPLSRAIGDHHNKDFGVISTPEVRSLDITPEDRFVIIASDGLWDAMSPREAAQFIADECSKTTDLNAICKTLSERARARGSYDDISVVLIEL